MTINKFLSNDPQNRKQIIEELEFFYYLHESYYHLLEKNGENTNPLISDFLEVLYDSLNWQSYKVQNYCQALFDHIFWQSADFYRESMEKFVKGEINGSEFVDLILYTILHDKRRARTLKRDVKKQALLQLDENHYEFGTIISNLTLSLESYEADAETDDNLIYYITEEELRIIVKDVLSKVQKYFN